MLHHTFFFLGFFQWTWRRWHFLEASICQQNILQGPGCSIGKTYALVQIRNVCGTGIETQYICTKYFYIPKYRPGVMLPIVKEKYLFCCSSSDPIDENETVFLYSCINFQIQCKHHSVQLRIFIFEQFGHHTFRHFCTSSSTIESLDLFRLTTLHFHTVSCSDAKIIIIYFLFFVHTSPLIFCFVSVLCY